MPCSTALVPTGFQSKWAHEKARRQNDLGSLQCYPIKGCIKNTLGAGTLPAVCMKHSHRDGLQGDRASQSILPHPSVCCPRAGDLKQLCNSGLGQCYAGKKAKQRKNKNCAGLTRAQPGTHSVLALLATEQHSLSKICVASLVINKAYLVLVLKAHFFPLFLNC